MSAFAAHVAALFANPFTSAAATYCPRDGAEVSLRVLRPPRGHTESGLFQTGTSQPADRAEVRVSDVAEPREGDFLVIDAVRYRVRKAEYDAERLTWLLDLDRKA